MNMMMFQINFIIIQYDFRSLFAVLSVMQRVLPKYLAMNLKSVLEREETFYQ